MMSKSKLLISVILLFIAACSPPSPCDMGASALSCDNEVTTKKPIGSWTVTETSSSTSVSESGSTDTFIVELATRVPDGNVIVDISSSDTGEVTVSPSSLTFSSDNYTTTQTVTVTGINDNLDDGNITSIITLTFNDSQSADESYEALTDKTISVTTTDDDTVGITVTESSSSTTVAESGSTDNFSVTLASQPLDNVTLLISSADTGEVTISPNNLTFTTGNWSIAQEVTVTGIDDYIVDGSQSVLITITVDNTSDSNYSNLADKTITVSNTDSGDTVGINVSETNSSTSVTESGATDNLSITLNSEPLADVILNIVSADTGEVTVSPSSLTFSSGNWSTAQEITLTAVEDNIIDGIQWKGVSVSVSSSVDASYAALGSQSITATINDSRTGRQRNNYISAGLKHYCALDNSSGIVYCWGDDTCQDDTFGNCDYDLQNLNVSTKGSGPIYPRVSGTAPDNTTHLGDNSTSAPLAMPSVVPSSPTLIASSRNTNCVTNSTMDNVTCWGRYRMNNYGIDSGSSIWRQSNAANSILDMEIGREHGCVIWSDRTVKCWGYARMGAIGDGNSTYYTDPGTAATGITNAVDLAVGQDHSCVLIDNGTVQCWGRDQSGQLGDNTFNTGGVNGGADDGSHSPVSVSGGITNFIQISAYSGSTCGLTDNGTIWCWGSNADGQLGDGTTTNRDYPVQVSGIDNALDVYLGTAIGCAAIDNRTNLKCWGNYYLGDGSTTGSTTSVTVTETNGWGSDYTFDDVAIGQSSACAYNLATNQLFCWGLNADGQLGLGNTLTPYSTMQNTGSPF